MDAASALRKCFNSGSRLWEDFLTRFERTSQNISYYPSAGTDLRPILYFHPENFDKLNINIEHSNYSKPDLFIFSDYFPYFDSPFFDTRALHIDDRTSIIIQDFCELYIQKDNYSYNFNEEYVHLDKTEATGRAVYFHASVYCHVGGSYEIDGIYFFYENVNLISQFFLRHNVDISHMTWIRDGTGLGGGNLRHSFLLPLGEKLNTKWYIIWDHYYSKAPHISLPEEIKEDLKNIKLPELNNLACIAYNGQDNVYFMEKAKEINPE